jgi:predicted nucleic acid-binding protein
MILVDSSVWIDFFNGKEERHVEKLYALLGNEATVTGELVMVDLVHGFKIDSQFLQAKEALETLPYFNLCNKEIVLQSAENYRILRKKGVTIRKTIDMILATFCTNNNIKLLHADKDFLPLEEFLGLQII